MNTFSDPHAIIDQLDIVGGQQVADFGAGAGSYALALAEKFKTSPSPIRIFALDVQKDLVERLEKEAQGRGLGSIYPLWVDVEVSQGTRLRDRSIDWVLIINTLFQVPDRSATLQEAARVLKPEGKLLMVDWSQSYGNLGPRDNEVISEEEARALIQEHGFTFEQTVRAGAHHYGFIARKVS